MAIPSTEGLNLSLLYGYTLNKRLKFILTAIPSTEGLNLSLWLYPQSTEGLNLSLWLYPLYPQQKA